MVYYKIVGTYPNYRSLKSGRNILIHDYHYFTTIDKISEYYDEGIYLSEVTVPDNEEVQFVNNQYRCKQIILGPLYSLFDSATYTKFNLDLPSDTIIVDTAARYGDISALEQWQSYNFVLPYSSSALDMASANNQLAVLQWFEKVGLKLKFSHRALDLASKKGHIRILDWWLNQKCQLKYTSKSMDMASAHGHTNVLNWWINSKLELKYTTDAVDFGSKYCQIAVLNWWFNVSKNSKIEFKFSSIALYLAGSDDTIDWWRNVHC